MDIITTENMHKYSEQQVFDYVVEFLYQQGEPSVAEGTIHCLYRGPKGIKCAAGILIPNKIYRKKWDGKIGKTYKMLVEESLVPKTHQELITELQSAHDSWATISNLKQFIWEFKRVAEKFNLKFDASKYK